METRRRGAQLPKCDDEEQNKKIPTRRRSIHSPKMHDDETNKQQVPQKCDKCKIEFLVEEKNKYEQPGEELRLNDQSVVEKECCQANAVSPILCIDCKTIEKGFGKLRYVIILAAFILTLSCIVFSNKVGEKSFEVKVVNRTRDEIALDDDLDKLEEIYRAQEDKVWFTLAAGIKSVIKENPNKPTMFLLLFSSEEAGNTAKCLAKTVSKAATKYIMKRANEPLIFSGAELNNQKLVDDPGHLLVNLENKVKESGAMIITNLQDVPPAVATSFHYFCDRFSPLVEKAVYFFTLKLEKVPQFPLQKIAESALSDIWSGLPDNILHPLITRMTSNVLRISSDYSDC